VARAELSAGRCLANEHVRLSQHRGQTQSGGGNHGRSIVGTALVARDGHACPTWGVGNSATSEIRAGEIALEREVSSLIGAMPFLWISMTTNRVQKVCVALWSATQLRFSATTEGSLSTLRRMCRQWHVLTKVLAEILEPIVIE
jgi:hypothetical protein